MFLFTEIRQFDHRANVFDSAISEISPPLSLLTPGSHLPMPHRKTAAVGNELWRLRPPAGYATTRRGSLVGRNPLRTRGGNHRTAPRRNCGRRLSRRRSGVRVGGEANAGGADREMANKPHVLTLLARLELAHAAPRCGARSKRTGSPCKAPAMLNGRCRL